MKNKITAIIISAALLLASLTLAVFADGATLSSDVFTLKNVAENTTFTMAKEELKDESLLFIDDMFDTKFYNASLYGAYTASLVDADGLAVGFTEEMDVTVNIGDEYFDTEIFVFSIDKVSGVASPVVNATRDGANLTISGKDFAAMSDDIIVVMTSNKSLMTGPEYTIIPAAVCAGVALVAIIVSVVVVKKKAGRETITG